ncbi:BgTH12-02577 [Blumeria graminis f. sp. triticale]|uniref:BgTH12-02577 n=1 Tax=Blumeria graminis f. sp. triticale TaxID=1689686 RepID=A0A9W4D2D0_BLUGR|nr:BgTH12-02577 [Blumeria graminis f. sp. triticale]
MNTTATYTPLECLLLFQSLVALGTDDEDFIKISDLLKKSPLVCGNPSYDPKRLDAKSLQQLYLRILRDELRLEESDGREENSRVHPKNRKYLSSSPLLLNDSRKYKHKLHMLEDRLYAKYREYMIRSIDEDERKFASLQEEIEKIENGDWNEGLTNPEKGQKNRIKFTPIKNNGYTSLPSSENDKRPENFSKRFSPALLSSSSHIFSSKTKPAVPSEGQELHSGEREEIDSLPSKIVGDQTSIQLSLGPRYNCSIQDKKSPQSKSQKPSDSKWKSPHGDSRQASPQEKDNQIKSQQNSSQSNSVTPWEPCIVSALKPIVKSNSSIQAATTSRIRFSIPHSAGTMCSRMSLDTLAEAAGQQNRVSLETLSNPAIHQPNKNVLNSRSNLQKISPNKVPQQNKQKSLSQSLFSKSKKVTSQRLIKPERKHYNSPYNTGRNLPVQSLSCSKQKIKGYQNLPSTPHVFDSRKFVTGTGTKWKAQPSGLTPRNFTPLPPPPIEPLSPILKSAKLMVHDRKSTSKDLSLQKKHKPQAPSPHAPYGKNFNISSTPAVIIPPKIRADDSRSKNKKMDDALDPQDDEDFSQTKFKNAKNIGSNELVITKLLHTDTSNYRSTKRKRGKFYDIGSRPPSTILWTRAFPKISAQALQDIVTDKNASMFANPIKEKDAPGYRTIILRPQDLKSIRSAITAGHRAATAAAPEDLSPYASSAWLPISEDLIPPKGIINYSQLEKELMRMFANAIMFNADPKRGLGPAWQDVVERNKEEALGYAFDEDSIVRGTKDMFAAVEKKVSDLRSVERRNEVAKKASLATIKIDDKGDESEQDLDR